MTALGARRHSGCRCCPFPRVGPFGRPWHATKLRPRSEEHTSELQSRQYLVCRLLLEKKKERTDSIHLQSNRLLRTYPSAGPTQQIEPSQLSHCSRPHLAPLEQHALTLCTAPPHLRHR